MKGGRWADGVIGLVLLAGNLLLLAPYLATDLSTQPWTTEYTFAGLARLFRTDPWTWNALWYAGLPFSYAYPPLFHATVAAVPILSPGRAYHLVSGLGYALVPAGVYLLGLALFRSRFAAGLAALAYSVFPAPLYFFFHDLSGLAHKFSNAPWPFVTLVEYAEAPHNAALALVVLAVAAAWKGRWIPAGLLAAGVILTNWPGMVGLAIGLAAVAVAQGRQVGYGKAAARLLTTAAVGYGLAAFWITPGYFRTTALLAWVRKYAQNPPAPWNAATWAVLIAAAALLLLAFWRRTPPLPAFLLTWLALSGAPVAAYYLSGSHLVPEPWRYGLELNLGLILAVAALGAAGFRWRVALVVGALVLAWFTGEGFLSRAWRLQPRNADVRGLISYQIADWLRLNAGESRVFTAGDEIPATLNVWTDVAQIAGGSPQGVSNPLIAAVQHELLQGCARSDGAAGLAELWLRALHSRYAVVHGAASREHYHPFAAPENFSALPVAWTNGAGDTIYRLPPPDLHEAVVVDASALDALPPLRSTDDLQFLSAYVLWAQGKRPARLRWFGQDRAELEAEVQANEAVLVKMNYDRGWRAAGARTRSDPIGFLLLELPAGRQRVELSYGAAWDVWLGRAITLVTAALLLARAPAYVVVLAALLPAAAGYAVLAGTPSRAVVSEATFRRVRAPMIVPEGIVDGVTFAPPPLVRGHPISIFGRNFGSAGDPLRLWVGGREAAILYRSPKQVNILLPDDAPAAAEIAVEVGGCRGNAFLVHTRD